MIRRDHPFLNVDPYKDLLEEVEPLRGLSPDETGWMVDAACATAKSIADSGSDRELVLEYQDPVPADSRALWQRLRAAGPSPWWRK